MALSENVLKKLITPNAKALSSTQGDKFIDEGPVGRGDDFDDSMFLAETYEEPETIESKGGYLSESAAAKARALTDYSSNDFNPDRVKNSKMSNAILEDMVKHPIDTTALNTQKLESAGNGNVAVNNSRLNKMLAGAKLVEERLGDTPGRPVRTQALSVGGGGIDYALIKTIVNECLEQKLSEMAERGLLSEGTTLKGIGLSEGKIKLVDNKGNVFQAKLEYKGNTKDKK
jgi:hypothetical protein